MSINTSSSDDIIYAVDDKPGVTESFFAALQHVLASFVGIITPTLIIGGVLGLAAEIPYLISMALFVSGVGTVIQARRVGPVGSGLICVQGTSFAFLGTILATGFTVKATGGNNDEVLATIFAVCFLAAFVEVFISFFISKLGKIIKPVVTGVVITTIGIYLIKVGMTDIGGGQWLLTNMPEKFASTSNLIVGFSVVALVVLLNASKNQWVRLTAVVVAMILGWLLAFVLGIANFKLGEFDLIAIPLPFKYGFNVDFGALIAFGFLYLITAIESTGDITANCAVSKLPVRGPSYLARIRGGILGDGVNSMIAALFNTFPNTTFSQNNGVIQLTGVASRYIGLWIGSILIILGLFPVIGAVLQNIPKPVLGGATLVMFGTVAAAGVKILASEKINRRSLLIIAVSLGLGLGVSFVPELFANAPKLVTAIFGSAVTVSGITAIIMTLVLPENYSASTDHLN
ncbi:MULTISPECIES: nucleobase:cation symporter-2 family protein [Pseudoalteromonas]|jgi:xanthine permease XanP|uniref:uracil-xanthine permease family protein n=1 Tax=Pseudoalteromonas TaxID=53246 RepID=UPI0004238743|nr:MULTISPECIES: nucleobase:cation symporter-2 family protein [Pseudoalteromonas]MBB1431305.1 purine permease [Pseudoalteromonas sp. SG43-4]MBB1454499.1 purine permease [Pseudoalteromonas sp. SG43-5]TVU78333.1 purine permease [Pseudoalteromonas elyakovii]|tara:strand:- start:259 stop:1635 length:1377 start_codon:yes stop_codon:yes gene_type:complete